MNQNRNLFFGLIMVGFSAGTALLSVLWTPYDPLEINPDVSLAKPSWSHLLGTDVLGRDVLSNLLVGSRTTLITAFLVVIIAMAMGVTAGISAEQTEKQEPDMRNGGIGQQALEARLYQRHQITEHQ